MGEPNQVILKHTEIWLKLQPILEKFILKNNISSLDKGLELLLSWFEIISKNSDKIYTFKSLVGLSPDMTDERKLRNSCSSINELVDREDINMNPQNGSKKRLSSDDDLLEIKNKRMKVSRLLCNEEMGGSGSPNSLVSTDLLNNSINGLTNTTTTTTKNNNNNNNNNNKTSDEENSDEIFNEEDETSYPDSFDSNDGNSPNQTTGEGEEFTSENEGLQIDEDSMIKLQQIQQQRRHLHSTIDLTQISKHSIPQVQNNNNNNNNISTTNTFNSSPTPSPTSSKSSSLGNSLAPSPKQLMTIREKMLEYIQKNPNTQTRANCISVCQNPTSKVVWKNRRLDTPFKLKLDLKAASEIAQQPLNNMSVISIGVVTDHKGKLQIDSVENFTEPFNNQGISVFQSLKMTKGTWGKEWNLTFIAVVRPNSASYNNPIILSVSQPFPIVVKTRKNPQIRHNNNSNNNSNTLHNSLNGGYPHLLSASENSSSSPDTSPTMQPRRGRHPSAPTISLQQQIQQPQSQQQQQQQSSSTSSPITPSTNPTKPYLDDMASLLWAAEIKQQSQDGNDKDYHGVIISTPKPLVSTR